MNLNKSHDIGLNDTDEGPEKEASLGGAVAQAVECGRPGEEVLGLIPAVAAHSLLVVSVSV